MPGKSMIVVFLALLFVASTANAASIVYSDETAFLTATGATSATGPLPSLGNVGLDPITIGDVTIQSASGNLFISEWTSRLPGNDIAISGVENLDITVNLASTFAFGFRVVEPEFDPNVNGLFVESTFTVSLFDGVSFLESFTFEPPNDTAHFFGVWSMASFDSVEIRETIGGIGNEFFGEMFTSERVPPAGNSVPVPGAGPLGLLGMGVMAAFAARRRRR